MVAQDYNLGRKVSVYTFAKKRYLDLVYSGVRSMIVPNNQGAIEVDSCYSRSRFVWYWSTRSTGVLRRLRIQVCSASTASSALCMLNVPSCTYASMHTVVSAVGRNECVQLVFFYVCMLCQDSERI